MSESGQTRPSGRAMGTSALPPIATELRKSRNGSFEQQWTLADLFDHLVGNQQKVATDCQTKRSGRLQIYHQFEFGWLLYG